MLRTHFIIKPRIQLRYMLISLLIVCLTAIAVYYTFWSALVGSPGMDQLSGGELRAIYDAYNVSFIWVVVILGVGIALLNIFYFHRLIGPIFVMERVVKALTRGDFSVTMHLRKHDELKELAAYVQEMLANLRAAVQTDRAKIEQIKTLLDQGKVTQAKDGLNELSQWFKLEPPSAPKE